MALGGDLVVLVVVDHLIRLEQHRRVLADLGRIEDLVEILLLLGDSESRVCHQHGESCDEARGYDRS